jgi:hypothetical protein
VAGEHEGIRSETAVVSICNSGKLDMEPFVIPHSIKQSAGEFEEFLILLGDPREHAIGGR